MTQYDTIAAQYVAAKENSDIVEDMEYHTFIYYLLFPALGIKNAASINLKSVLSGYHVLDLACGAGYLTRRLKEDLGCETAIGVDISPSMIDIARNSEKVHPLGIIYEISDVLSLTEPVEKFDFVVAFYLLNYAKTVEELDSMVHIIARQLKDNDQAHFLSINANICAAESIVNTDKYHKYGYSCSAEVPLINGTPVNHKYINQNGSEFSFTTYYMSQQTYENAFKKAGFKTFKWVSIQAARSLEWYADFLKHPWAIGIFASK